MHCWSTLFPFQRTFVLLLSRFKSSLYFTLPSIESQQCIVLCRCTFPSYHDGIAWSSQKLPPSRHDSLLHSAIWNRNWFRLHAMPHLPLRNNSGMYITICTWQIVLTAKILKGPKQRVFLKCHLHSIFDYLKYWAVSRYLPACMKKITLATNK